MGAETTLKDDIAYMRGLAEDGRRGPVLGASILFISGLIYSVAAVASWLIHSGAVPLDLPLPGMEWWAAGLIQMVFVIVLSRRLPRQGGASSRLFGVVWSSLGISIFVFMLALSLMHWRFGQEIVWVAMPAFVMAVYGVGWSINAMLVQRAWMHVVAVISFLAAVLTGFTVVLPDALGLLVYAALIFAVVCVPGLILMRETAGAESLA